MGRKKKVRGERKGVHSRFSKFLTDQRCDPPRETGERDATRPLRPQREAKKVVTGTPYLEDVDELPRPCLVPLVEVRVRNPLLAGSPSPTYPVDVVLCWHTKDSKGAVR